MHARRAPPVAPLACGLALALAGACGDWPRHAHLPASGDPDALPAGADSGAPAGPHWTGPVGEDENGAPGGLPLGAATPLDLDEGLLVQGTLTGSGWVEGPVDTTGTCGPLAFPPGGQGSYLADVEWVAVTPLAAGQLCARLEIDDDALQLDLVPYLLDACAEPAAVLPAADGSAPGFDAQGPRVAWSASVEAGAPLGVALAGFWPDAPTEATAWRLGLALVPADADCPALPEAP